MTYSKNKLVYGVGVNDADYVVQPTIKGRRTFCPFYKAWQNMLKRCYSEKYQKTHPTYIGCSVTTEWLTFSTFRFWMEAQQWLGRVLDKDILDQNNKTYGPTTCMFIAREINGMILDSAASRGQYPQGVSYSKRSRKFVAGCKLKGKRIHIGYFETVEEAYIEYKKFKYSVIKEVALKQTEPLRSALLNYRLEGDNVCLI